MVDTNSDPRGIDYVIPSNDDASKSISKILEHVCKSIKEGVSESRVAAQIPGFNLKLYDDPQAILTAVAGPVASGYGNIVDSVDALSSRKMFVHLVFLLKESP